MKRLRVICVAAAVPFMFAGPASADHSGTLGTMQVTASTPPDGATLEQTESEIPFSINVVYNPQPPYVLVKFSKTNTLDHFGFLQSNSASVQMTQSATDPTLYTPAFPPVQDEFALAGPTYWQAALTGGSLGFAATPLLTINFTARPPFLSIDDALAALKFRIRARNGTGDEFTQLKAPCTQTSNLQVDCSASWKTAKTKKWSYRGKLTAVLTDGPRIYDKFAFTFTGKRAATSCVELKSFKECGKPIAPWTGIDFASVQR